MTQYAWSAVFKCVPTDGPEEVLDLSELLADTTGPVRVKAVHPNTQTNRQDVNRRSLPVVWGFRGQCELDMELVNTDHQAYLSMLVNRLGQPTWTMYLSLNGGLTYRQVSLVKWEGPKPLAGKTFAGAAYTLTVETTDLLDQVPLLGTGTW